MKDFQQKRLEAKMIKKLKKKDRDRSKSSSEKEDTSKIINDAKPPIINKDKENLCCPKATDL